MASDVDIANLALSHIGADVIVAMSPPDGSVEAAHCARFWPIARAELQEAFDWSFNEDRNGALGQITSVLDNWTFAYTLPADCIKVRKLLPYGATAEKESRPFILIDRAIYTNEENPVVVYSKLVTDPTKFTPTFVTTGGYLLASYLCGPILKKPGSGQAYYDMAMQRGRAAAALNANASASEEHDEPASWMTSR